MKAHYTWVLGATLVTACLFWVIRTHLVSSVSRPEISIRVIGPTGDSYRGQPIWRFAITNTGSAKTHWKAGTSARGGNPKDFDVAWGHIDFPYGYDLHPGDGFETNMIVPSAPGCSWRAGVDYWTSANSKGWMAVTGWLEATNQTVQPMGASRSAHETNRTSQAAGSHG